MLLKKTKTIEGQTVTTATKGLATGSWTRVPTTTAEVKAETNYVLYDYKYRPIRSYTTNYLGGYTYTDSKLDVFSGQLQYTVQKHKRTVNNAELTVKEAFTYSPQDRLIQHTHQINGGVVQLLADNTYDELGKLTSKKVGNTSATPLQKVDYSYNIRGWMTAINSIANLNVGTDPADLFSFKLNYNSVDGSTSAANPLYNGNIAETFWRTATDGGFVRNYGYKYDNLNRLKDATYQKSGQVTGMYNENLSYDKNGNIMNLSRYGDRDEQYLPIQIDNLQYGYATNSNKLMSVVDNSNNTSGFKDGITTGDDYVYDANGNMTVDKNKNITGIVYNHLNLPTKIIFPTGNIVYFYNASGQKVQKVVTENNTVTTTDYLGGYLYSNTSLQFFPTAEGYVKNTHVSGINTYSYVFNYTDHLGNTRLSYAKDTTTGSLKILEENNYYPFGLKHTPYNADNFQPDYKYKFQEQERQDELGLNWDSFKYRNYDYAIGRFMGIDPLAEKYSYQSPYNFSENQVIAYRELEGLEKVHYTYTFTKDKVSVAKTSINGPLGNGVLVSSNHGGKMTYYYGNTIASSLVAFKKAYEGNNIDAKGNHVGYNDHLGNPTIGYGHKIVDGDTFTVGSKISEKKAQSLFESDSKWIINSADEYLEDFDLNQNQTNALYDAAFNMGPGRLSEYTEDGSKFSGGNFFLQFMGGGDGLKKRRYAENILYNEGESVHLDRLKGKSMEQITDYLNSLLKKDEKKK